MDYWSSTEVRWNEGKNAKGEEERDKEKKGRRHVFRRIYKRDQCIIRKKITCTVVRTEAQKVLKNEGEKSKQLMEEGKDKPQEKIRILEGRYGQRSSKRRKAGRKQKVDMIEEREEASCGRRKKRIWT